MSLTYHALVSTRIVDLIVARRLPHQETRRHHYCVSGAHRTARTALRLIPSGVSAGLSAISDHRVLDHLLSEGNFITLKHKHLLPHGRDGNVRIHAVVVFL